MTTAPKPQAKDVKPLFNTSPERGWSLFNTAANSGVLLAVHDAESRQRPGWSARVCRCPLSYPKDIEQQADTDDTSRAQQHPQCPSVTPPCTLNTQPPSDPTHASVKIVASHHGTSLLPSALRIALRLLVFPRGEGAMGAMDGSCRVAFGNHGRQMVYRCPRFRC
jgi:hypothetical protein